MSDHRERACTKCGSLLHHEDNCPRSCNVCSDPFGVRYLSQATKDCIDFDDLICALHDNAVEKELSSK